MNSQPLDEYMIELDALAAEIREPAAPVPVSGIFKAYEDAFYREQELEARISQMRMMGYMMLVAIVTLVAGLFWMEYVISRMVMGGARW